MLEPFVTNVFWAVQQQIQTYLGNFSVFHFFVQWKDFITICLWIIRHKNYTNPNPNLNHTSNPNPTPNPNPNPNP